MYIVLCDLVAGYHGEHRFNAHGEDSSSLVSITCALRFQSHVLIVAQALRWYWCWSQRIWQPQVRGLQEQVAWQASTVLQVLRICSMH